MAKPLITKILETLKNHESRLKATILYESTSSNYSNVSLNQNINNFSKLKIYAKAKMTSKQIIKEVDLSDRNFSISGMEYDNASKKSRNFCTNYSVSSDKIIVTDNVFFDRNYSTGSISGDYVNNVSIYKVEAEK